MFVGRKRGVRAGNTIEGGLMEIKTPYRIPRVSQMAALDGVGYRPQPSLGPLRASFPEDLGREKTTNTGNDRQRVSIPLTLPFLHRVCDGCLSSLVRRRLSAEFPVK